MRKTKSPQAQQVYRAETLSESDFASLVEKKGKKDARITMNGFISTSRDKGVALDYAKKKRCDKNSKVIIYEITIDPRRPSVSYANIEHISFHPNEKEILFNMGSIFQIDDVVNDLTRPDDIPCS